MRSVAVDYCNITRDEQDNGGEYQQPDWAYECLKEASRRWGTGGRCVYGNERRASSILPKSRGSLFQNRDFV